MSGSNTTLALVVTMGGAVLAWVGIVDPPGGLVGATQRVINHEPAAGAGKAKSDPLGLVSALYTGGGTTAGAGTSGDSSGAGTGTGGTVTLVRPVPVPFAGHYGVYASSGKPHPALDFPVESGTPVRAGAAGRVIFAGWDTTGYGWMVEIRMDNGWTLRYGHNSALNVLVGQRVTAGQIISRSGSTGNSTGPHVHMAVLDKSGHPFDFTSLLASGGAQASPPKGLVYA